MGNVILGVVIIASGVISLIVVVALVIWGAVKDGQDNDEAKARLRGDGP
jgi:hypothetical protein